VKNASRGLLALVAAVSIGALPSAAHAERVVHKDGSGDAIYSTYDAETNQVSEEVQPAAKAGDITRTVVSHGTRKVALTVDFRVLKRGDALSGHWVRIVTNEGVKRDLFLQTTKEDPQGTLSFAKTATGEPVTCKGLSHDVDYGDARVVIKVPRSCLSSPRWVRVGTMSYRYASSTSYDGYLDDANKVGAYSTNGPVLGKRVSKN
jgi:hypothetical protein